MKKTKLNISWMHCTSCSKLIESSLSKNEYIKFTKVNFWNNKALIEYDENKLSENEIISLIEKSGYKASQEDKMWVDETHEWLKKSIFGFLLSIPLVVFMVYDFVSNLPYDSILMPYMAIISFIIASIIQFSLWLAFYKWTYAALRQKTTNMYSLIAIWTTVAFAYSLYSFIKFYIETWSIIGLNGMKIEWIYFEVSALLITFVCFWKYLESKAKSKTNESISKLLTLTPKTAFVKIDWEFREISIELIKIWDTILVKPGDKIPVDWKITVWNASIDESMLTWESMPVDKNITDKVLAWTINKYTSFEMIAEKIWAWTMISQIITLLEEASMSKSDIEWFADRISKVFVLVVMILSILTFVVWYFILSWTFENALLLACSVIVIACPCALWLATPTAVIVWTWIAAKSWILIKWGSALEKWNYITAVALDKTWTITSWNPVLQDVVLFWDYIEKDILEIALSLENNSNHPISKAFVNYAKQHKINLIQSTDFKIMNWLWIIWKVNDIEYLIWNKRLINEKNINIKGEILENFEKLIWEWKTVLFLSNNTEILALIAVSDSVKETSKNAINILKNMWIEVFMITWDNKNSAKYIASQVWIKIDNIYAEVLPQDKWSIIKEIQAKWYKVAMVWDWINDSIAMENSDLAISMWSWNDVALESSDIVLMKNDLNDIVTALWLSKKTVSKIKQNLFFSLFYNSLWIPIAAWVFINFWLFLKPELAWLAMALSSVSVVTNSLFLKLSVKNKYISTISLVSLLLIFTSIFIWFASLNKIDSFEKVYTLNNEKALNTITDFITSSKNKINIIESPTPKIFIFSDKLPENIKIKSWVNSLKEDEVIIWYMDANMMIKKWLIKWVWDELTNFFWIPKVKIVAILAKTDTILDDVHILNNLNYDKIDGKNDLLFIKSDKEVEAYYLFDETNIPNQFVSIIDKSKININPIYLWFELTNMIKETGFSKINDKANLYWNDIVYLWKFKKTYTSFDMMHFVSKAYFKREK